MIIKVNDNLSIQGEINNALVLFVAYMLTELNGSFQYSWEVAKLIKINSEINNDIIMVNFKHWNDDYKFYAKIIEL
ncbi:hypothetical protein WCLP8_3270025 [uncultured Gammaproteobacteria bacterium]